LNLARFGAGACFLRGFAYVFAGKSFDNKTLNSIERNKIFAHSNFASPWELLSVKSSVFAQRKDPVVVPLNDTQIVILGGKLGSEYVGDLVIFDTLT